MLEKMMGSKSEVVQAQLFYEGVRAFLNVLTANIQDHPNFKKAAEGLDLRLSIAIRTPESFKQFNISDTFIHLRIADLLIEAKVDTEPSKADIVIQGDWDTWKKIVIGQEDIMKSLTDGKIDVEIPSELKVNVMDLFSVLIQSTEKSRVPTELLGLVEPR